MKAVLTNNKRSSPRQVASVGVKTRVCLSDQTVLVGELGDVSDSGAGIRGDTTGLEVGDEVWLAVLYAMVYCVEYKCEVRHIEPGQGFGVKFKSKSKRCMMRPSNMARYEAAV